jgi:hypothetical protein
LLKQPRVCGEAKLSRFLSRIDNSIGKHESITSWLTKYTHTHTNSIS